MKFFKPENELKYILYKIQLSIYTNLELETGKILYDLHTGKNSRNPEIINFQKKINMSYIPLTEFHTWKI